MNLPPLEVLPGWPEPEPVSDLTILMLTIGGPLALGAVIALLAFGPKLARRQREAQARSTDIERAHRA